MDSILLIHCAEGAKKALKRMEQLGHRLPAQVRTFELPCTGRVNDAVLMETLRDGADGILVVGCRRENCKYLDGNLRAEKRVERIRQILSEADISGKHVEMILVAPDEGKLLYDEVSRFSETVLSRERSA
jgi:coenzyme F420-reducing hydrogenase delta subunit